MATGIGWTDETWNPVTGCDQISLGCDNCYALSMAGRLKLMGADNYQKDGDARSSGPGFGLTEHPHMLDRPKRWRKPRMVFVCSMSDLMHAKVSTGFIRHVFDVMAECDQHTFQLLTKRPSRLAKLTSGTSPQLVVPPNVWVGTTIESDRYSWRADRLREIPASVRFLSCEPLLGPLDTLDMSGIGWVIAGGESGRGARPMDLDWVRALRDRSVDADIPFYFKQWGGLTPKSGGRDLDGRTWDQFPLGA